VHQCAEGKRDQEELKHGGLARDVHPRDVAARRADQQALADAATAFAENYESILAKQVGALLEAAEFNEDPDTFRRRLDELLEQGPTIEQLQPVQRASLFARMMGALRAQRRAE
jgi:hypothetical protein